MCSVACSGRWIAEVANLLILPAFCSNTGSFLSHPTLWYGVHCKQQIKTGLVKKFHVVKKAENASP
jgi:hypothetical protein